MKLTGEVLTYRIADLEQMMADGRLILAPSFQRGLVWNNTHASKFIETILNELPFPEIFLAYEESSEEETFKLRNIVVDGQQRLSTIHRYITSDSSFKVKHIKHYDELSYEERQRFLDYRVVVRHLGHIAHKDVVEVFSRINAERYALNAIEISNALYEGEFITTGKNILEHNDFFSKIDVFSGGEVSRFKDLEFVLLIMATLEEGGYFPGTKEIETYVKRYDEEYPKKEEMFRDFKTALELLNMCELPADSIWYKKSSLFILIVELIKHFRHSKTVPNLHSLTSILNELEEELRENKNGDMTKNPFAEYYYYTFQGTSGRLGRNKRAQLLRSYLNRLS